MRLERLRVVNIKGIEELDISPARDAHMVFICGENGAGKSTAIDSFMMVMAGKRHWPDMPIRKGEREGLVHVDLGELVADLKLRAGSAHSLTVKSRDGKPLKAAPQTTLSNLVGPLAYDPIEFVALEPARQSEILRELVGLDLSDLDAERSVVYDRRTEVNREMRAAEARRDEIEKYPDAPEAIVSVADLMRELDEIEERNSERRGLRDSAEDIRSEIGAIDRAIGAADAEIKRLAELIEAQQKRREEHERDRAAVSGRLVELEAQIDKAGPIENTGAIREQIDGAEELNEQIRANLARAALDKECRQLADQSKDLSNELERIDANKRAAIANAKWPLEGMAIEGDTITLGRVPIEQLATHEQIRMAVAIGLELGKGKELPIICIRNASLLSPKTLGIVDEMVKAAGAMAVLEMVGALDDANAFEIVDGRLVEGSAQ